MTATTLASYFDGSGTYDIRRDGDTLITDINSGSEIIVQSMTRAPQFDQWEFWPDFMLTDNFGSTPDLGDDGAVLINGEAFVTGDPRDRNHRLESLELSEDSGLWTATCSCSNPDGNGVGLVEFSDDYAPNAVFAWQEHAEANR